MASLFFMHMDNTGQIIFCDGTLADGSACRMHLWLREGEKTVCRKCGKAHGVDAPERKVRTKSVTGLVRKNFEGEHKAQKAGDSDMEAINRYALEPLTAEQVFIGQMHLANTRVDRSYERFTKAYLDRFAETLPGKSVLPGHDYQAVPVGRFFDAKVAPDDDGHVLMARYFMLADDAMTVKVKAGVASYVSIGFHGDKRVCDLDSKDYDDYFAEDGCPHIAGKEYDGRICTLTWSGDAQKAEAVEGSFVYLGCQYRAEAVQGQAVGGHQTKEAYLASKGPEPHKEAQGESMEIKEALAEIERLKGELATAKALGDDGAKFRAHLKSEITRLAGTLEKTGTYASILKHMETADSDTLSPVLKELQAAFDLKFGGKGAGAPPDPDRKEDEQPRRFDPSRRAPLPVARN